VRRVYRLTPDQIQSTVATISSSDGTVIGFDDGITLIADTVGACQAASDLLDQIEAADVPQWLVQLHLVSITERAAREFGLDVTPTVDVSAALASAASGGWAAATTGRVALSALLKAARDKSVGRVEASPLLLMIDGKDASFSRGQRTPVPRRSVSPQGTVQVQAYDFLDVGLNIKAHVREAGEASALLTLTLDLREVVGQVESIPVTDGIQWEGQALVANGGVYLLGEVSRRDQTAGEAGPFNLRWNQAEGSSLLQIWATVSRVGGLLRR